MKIFITGIAGLIGYNLAKFLVNTYKDVEIVGIDNGIGGVDRNLKELSNYNNIEVVKGDITDTELIKVLMQGADTVIHTAAYPYEGLSVFSPSIVANSIVTGTLSVASACIHNNVRLLINCSSMARYGEQIPPFTEDMPRKPVDPYGLAKAQAEEHLELLSKIHGLNFVTVVPHNVIGVGQRYYDPFRNVVSIMISRTLQGKPIVVYGDGEQKRSFSDVTDCVKAIHAIMISDRDLCGQVYNIGPDHNEISVKQLGNIVLNTCNSTLNNFIFFPDRPIEVKNAYCSSDKIKNEFNYNTTYSTEETIEAMVNWIKEDVREFSYHLPLEFITDKTPATWTQKLI